MKEYRTILTNVPNERKQTISRELKAITDWTDAVLAKFPTGIVEIYVAEEIYLSRKHGAAHTKSSPVCGACAHARSRHLLSSSTNDTKTGICMMCDCKRFEEAKT